MFERRASLSSSRHRSAVLVAALATMFIGGCGGGAAGDNATPAASPSINTQAASSGDIASAPGVVSSVPVATYTYGTNEWYSYERLNRNRSTCGFGLLAQSPELDHSAAAHVNYLERNQVVGHAESAGAPGFTGASPVARAAAAGYVGRVGEVLAAGFLIPSIFPRGDVITEMLMDVPYHAVVALEGLRDVGIGSVPGAIVIDPGMRAGAQLQSSADVLTYPCEGIRDVRAAVANEEPSPFPADAPGTQSGPSISVVGKAVRVTAASITGASGSVAIKAILGDGATRDPNGFCTGRNACVIPQPLQPGIDYQVHLEGTDNGVAFTRDFTFTTAAR